MNYATDYVESLLKRICFLEGEVVDLTKDRDEWRQIVDSKNATIAAMKAPAPSGLVEVVHYRKGYDRESLCGVHWTDLFQRQSTITIAAVTCPTCLAKLSPAESEPPKPVASGLRNAVAFAIGWLNSYRLSDDPSNEALEDLIKKLDDALAAETGTDRLTKEERATRESIRKDHDRFWAQIRTCLDALDRLAPAPPPPAPAMTEEGARANAIAKLNGWFDGTATEEDFDRAVAELHDIRKLAREKAGAK